MQQFEQQKLVNVPLKETLQAWISADYYPRFRFSTVPEIPEQWSSSDAWGENIISGSRQVSWTLLPAPATSDKQINWRVQSYLKGALIEYSGCVVFESSGFGRQTRVTLQMNWMGFGSELGADSQDAVLQSCLDSFKRMLESQKVLSEFKVAV